MGLRRSKKWFTEIENIIVCMHVIVLIVFFVFYSILQSFNSWGLVD